MDQIAAALSHYWHLRAQGHAHSTAQRFAEQRFGVNVDAESADDLHFHSMVVEDAPLGSEFVGTIFGSSTGPQDSLRRGE